ncbi:MAG: aerobic carbon-monoxide dehydrogenase medium subunit [Solirubrobacteraceae bacterium]|nr:aerobic carbon-monoxide dehydrogenase medium subunit [Solirubrobacteraceae bacterium]
MKPARFRYVAPETIAEVLGLLDEHDDGEAKVLAGGQSLIPLMNLRLARPEVLVDVNRLAGLSGIAADGAITIGATTRQAEVARAPEVMAGAPLGVEALRFTGHPGTRARGTFGGIAAHADAASEMLAVLLALGAEVTVAGPSGERAIAAADLFVTTFTTSLAETELLTSVRLPKATATSRWAFQHLARRHGDFALVGVAAVADVDDDGRCAGVRIALSGVADVPVLALEAQELLEGGDLAAQAHEAGRLAAARIDPPDDFHATRRYRRQITETLVARAVRQLAEEAPIR